MIRLLAANDIDQVFGKVNPPAGMGKFSADPGQAVGNLLGFGIQIVFIVAGIMVLIYMLWGGLDWITSGGEKEKVVKAQNKIMNAILGLFIVIAAVILFSVINSQILGGKIIQNNPGGGWSFTIPKL